MTRSDMDTKSDSVYLATHKHGVDRRRKKVRLVGTGDLNPERLQGDVQSKLPKAGQAIGRGPRGSRQTPSTANQTSPPAGQQKARKERWGFTGR